METKSLSVDESEKVIEFLYGNKKGKTIEFLRMLVDGPVYVDAALRKFNCSERELYLFILGDYTRITNKLRDKKGTENGVYYWDSKSKKWWLDDVTRINLRVAWNNLIVKTKHQLEFLKARRI